MNFHESPQFSPFKHRHTCQVRFDWSIKKYQSAGRSNCRSLIGWDQTFLHSDSLTEKIVLKCTHHLERRNIWSNFCCFTNGRSGPNLQKRTKHVKQTRAGVIQDDTPGSFRNPIRALHKQYRENGGILSNCGNFLSVTSSLKIFIFSNLFFRILNRPKSNFES